MWRLSPSNEGWVWEWEGNGTSQRALTGERILCFSLLNCLVQLHTLLSKMYSASDICGESPIPVTSVSLIWDVRTQTRAGAPGTAPKHKRHTRRGTEQRRRHIRPEESWKQGSDGSCSPASPSRHTSLLPMPRRQEAALAVLHVPRRGCSGRPSHRLGPPTLLSLYQRGERRVPGQGGTGQARRETGHSLHAASKAPREATGQ